MQTVRAEELKKIGEGAFLLDVRTPGEFKRFHVRGAVNLPLDGLVTDRVRELAGGRPVYILCQSGGRAKTAAERLIAAGLSGVKVVEGGLLACRSCGVEIEEGAQGAIPLERQVRIAAGLLVLLGVVLGFSVAPGFYLLSAFVGAGLVYSGVTDTCGMSCVLARMPWNG
jgi:rhodanese-related sulfurtransferase